MTENNRNKKKYTVTYPRKVKSEYGYNPSLLRYLASRIIVPIGLTFLFAMMNGGLPFIVLTWAVFLLVHVSNYKEIYPSSRPATEEEIQAYLLTKKKEAVKLKDDYDRRLKRVNSYGYLKSEDESDLDYIIKKQIDRYGESYKDERERKIEAKKRAEMEEKLAEIESEYGANWYEEFKKEIEEHARRN